MRYRFLIAAFIFISLSASSQELFVFTEPASNMAAKSIGLRLNNLLMGERSSSKINYHVVPEIMLGISKTIMAHADIFLSNRNKNFVAEGGSVYLKYRIFSIDDVQKHFRVAAFARGSINNSDIHQEEINIYGHNSGWEAGIIVTQLIHKIALSSGIYFTKALDNGKNKFTSSADKAVNYTLSVGKLVLPKEYKDYNQTNMNLMLEFVSQLNITSGKYYLDIAPSVQLIINSQSRIDLGYKKQLSHSLLRTAPNGFLVRLEHNLFNAW